MPAWLVAGGIFAVSPFPRLASLLALIERSVISGLVTDIPVVGLLRGDLPSTLDDRLGRTSRWDPCWSRSRGNV